MPITTYYNGACPVCGTAIDRYRRAAGPNDPDFAWCDVSAVPEAADRLGTTVPAIRRRLHVVDDDGRLLVGVPAFAALWAALPGFGWRARLVRLPVVGPVARLLYEGLAAVLDAWNRRR
jgi:predicted DCC family thiol-disulfide oxidoreductase YuxK